MHIRISSLLKTIFTFIGLLWLTSCDPPIEKAENINQNIWFNKPASKWIEALPIGNGRLGAMVYGGIATDTIQINEESLWGGLKINDNNPKSADALPKIQELMLEGKINEGSKLVKENMLGTPLKLRSYQTFMNMILDYGEREVSEYKRELDLIDGISRVTYKANGVPFSQESFTSLTSNVLVVHMKSPEPFDLSISLDRERDANVTVISNNELLLVGQLMDEETKKPAGPSGLHMKFAGHVMVIPSQGEVKKENNHLRATSVKEITLLINAATNYDFERTDLNFEIDEKQRAKSKIEEAKKLSYEQLKKAHITSFNSKMKRVDFKLGNKNYTSIPTDERLNAFYQGNDDLGLVSTYFQFGRYLLLSSSNEMGLLPANLQGVWNKEIRAPWNSDYHTNINLQMNYWAADVCRLPETVQPLTNFVKKLAISGKFTAQEMFNSKGWVVNHCTDAFARTAPHDGALGVFPLAGAWMTLPLWRHYEFTQDTIYLKEEAWPIMKGAAQFALDFLIEDQNGNLISVPSQSPESSYIDPKTGENLRLTVATTMDMQIVRELFKNCLNAIEIVGEEENLILRSEIEKAMLKLVPTRIGEDGTLMEWYKDYKDVDIHHRHVSHLFGLYPGTQISLDTPELYGAAKKTLEKRGDDGTGWSLAWKISFWARLRDGNRAETLIKSLLEPVTNEQVNYHGEGGSYSNLLCAHPPFQIDGNLGSTAAIAEMLLQSHGGIIDVLPALPDDWKEGKVTGLLARGNLIVDIEWKKNKLWNLRIESHSENKITLKYRDKIVEFTIKKGESMAFNSLLELIKKKS